MAHRLEPRTDDDVEPPRSVRAVLVVTLVVFVVFGTFGFEAWPFTGWHLFSTVREQTEESWQAYAVDPGGEEERVVWIDLPTTFRQSDRLLSSLPGESADEAERICAGLREGILTRYPDLAEIRVYKVRDRLEDGGEQRVELERDLRFTCDDGAADR